MKRVRAPAMDRERDGDRYQWWGRFDAGDGAVALPDQILRGQAIATADFDACGVTHDREFVVIDVNGTFLTQRQVPRMALIAPEVVDGGRRVSAPVGDIDFLAREQGSGTRGSSTVFLPGMKSPREW